MKNRINVLLDCIQENYSILIEKNVFDNLTSEDLEDCISSLREKYVHSYSPNYPSKLKEDISVMKDEIDVENQSDGRDTLSLSGDEDADK